MSWTITYSLQANTILIVNGDMCYEVQTYISAIFLYHCILYNLPYGDF